VLTAVFVSGLMLTGTAVLVASATLAVAARRRFVVTVSGWSMTPTFADGERLLAQRAKPSDIRPGHIVVAAYPDEPARTTADSGALPSAPKLMIKRCVAGPGDPVPTGLPATCTTPNGRVPTGQLVLRSDNPTALTDSRRFGYLPAHHVYGIVLRRFRPATHR
jgi:signal peptidase I